MSGGQQIQPTTWGVDENVIRDAITTAEYAVEYCSEVLARHDSELGRSRKRHKEQAEYMERCIERSKQTVNALRRAIDWPEYEWKTQPATPLEATAETGS